MEDFLVIAKYDTIMEHSKWIKEIPYIEFPSDWKVQICPPSFGAVVRFRIKKDKADVSVYLDCYDKLGCCGKPYWEVYPSEDDVYRCAMEDIENLLNAIQKSIVEQND
jgi:hypothetical protein